METLGFLEQNFAKILTKKSRNLQDLARWCQEIHEISRLLSRVSRFSETSKNYQDLIKEFKRYQEFVGKCKILARNARVFTLGSFFEMTAENSQVSCRSMGWKNTVYCFQDKEVDILNTASTLFTEAESDCNGKNRITHPWKHAFASRLAQNTKYFK